MKSVFLVQSSTLGVVGAANTEAKARAMARQLAEYECWNCNAEITFHDKTIVLSNGELIDVRKVSIFTSAGKFAELWPVMQQ